MIEYRGYKISINKGDNLRKIEVRNERGKYNFSRLLNAREFINSCQYDDAKNIITIIDEVFKGSYVEYNWHTYENAVGTKVLGYICAVIWIDWIHKKAEITFINPTPFEPHKPMDKLIREYRCDFYMYYHVWEVKKIENRLIIKFR